jgi:hypothetical protein
MRHPTAPCVAASQGATKFSVGAPVERTIEMYYTVLWRTVPGTKAINVRVSDEEARMLKALAEKLGMGISDVIRQYVRWAFAETLPTGRPKRFRKSP